MLRRYSEVNASQTCFDLLELKSASGFSSTSIFYTGVCLAAWPNAVLHVLQSSLCHVRNVSHFVVRRIVSCVCALLITRDGWGGARWTEEALVVADLALLSS